MSGRRRRSESLWDRKDETVPQTTEISEKIPREDGSPIRSNSEPNDDVLMSDDFPKQSSRDPMQENDDVATYNDTHDGIKTTDPAFDESENLYRSRPSDNSYGLPYRGSDRGLGGTGNTSTDRIRSRSRSSSPHRTRDQDRDHNRDRAQDQDHNRGRDRDRDRTHGLTRSRSRSRSRGRARSPSKGGSSRLDYRPEHSGGGSRFRDDRNSTRDRTGYDDQDHRRQSNQSVKPPCRFFIMGNCNRSNCKFSHDPPKSEGYDGRSHDNIHGRNTEDNNPWTEQPPHDHHISGSRFSDFSNPNPNFDDDTISNRQIHSYGESFSQSVPSNLNGNGLNIQNKSGKLLEASRNDIPQVMNETISSLPIVESTVVNEPIKTSVPKSQPEVKVNENVEKSEGRGKGEEGNIGNDEKAMRAFKVALVEFVKEILKPTWKEGKMNREVYKTIVKKVVEKVTSTIQGIQIPRTQEKIDQYLAFSKSKITKLVEAYVGRFQKA